MNRGIERASERDSKRKKKQQQICPIAKSREYEVGTAKSGNNIEQRKGEAGRDWQNLMAPDGKAYMHTYTFYTYVLKMV